MESFPNRPLFRSGIHDLVNPPARIVAYIQRAIGALSEAGWPMIAARARRAFGSQVRRESIGKNLEGTGRATAGDGLEHDGVTARSFGRAIPRPVERDEGPCP